MQMDGGPKERTERPLNQDEGLEFDTGVYEPHPAGAFRAEFVGFERATAEDMERNPEYGANRIRLLFDTEAEMDNGEPFRISCWTKSSFHPKGRVRPMLTALGVDVDEVVRKEKTRGPEDPPFRLSAYAGGKLMLAIEHEPRKDGQGTRAVIKSFLPLPKPARKRPKFDEEDAETA